VSAGTAGANTGGSDNAAGSATAGSSAGGSVGGDSGGDPAAGGDAGGESPLPPPNQVELVRDKVPNKLDLLMMIDNSVSMADKQHLLADAMQHLVNRLVQPRCLD